LDHTELFNDIKDNNKLSEEYDAVFQDSSMGVTGKVHVQRSLIKRRRSSAPSDGLSGGRKMSIQSASSLFSQNAIQNDVREIETDLTEVCYSCNIFFNF